MPRPEQRTFFEDWDKKPEKPEEVKKPKDISHEEDDPHKVFCEHCYDAPGGCRYCKFRDNGLRAMMEKKKAG